MSFDRLAPHYRWLEFVLAGEKLQHCRLAFLDQIHIPTNVLLLGEGHGRCLLACRRRFPDACITCLDASEAMLVAARHRLAKHHLDSTNIKLTRADALNWTPVGGPFDLIITNFFLDCFRADQLENLIPRLASAATPAADWLSASDRMPCSPSRSRTNSPVILSAAGNTTTFSGG